MAQIGYKSKAYREYPLASGTYVQIPKVTNIDPPKPKYKEVDVTHLESPNATNEFVRGFKDADRVTIEMNSEVGNAVQDQLETDFLSGIQTTGQWRHAICDPDTGIANANQTYTYPGYIEEFSRGPIATEEKVMARLVIRVTGAIVIS